MILNASESASLKNLGKVVRFLTFLVDSIFLWRKVSGLAPSDEVVDLGCGCGLLARLALRSGASGALAVEIAPHLARLAQRILPQASWSP